ncbi:HupE/UreJ family protein [Photobacterium sp. 1_MG-2023]|uniref:HupE/UreJ family protein n=1 Tax=Photobacterium sp. 1_MG-2023 TaxID=3062646 RepID=UPI0026E25CA7|nr:HupE/UreJ family protein [Photobacterium sp. 1_MG-2023]MDO6705585.1 HupE/UreJ family protein [Photobacterium sp. 1_MG-2023]
MLISSFAQAHQLSTSYLTLQQDGKNFTGNWQVQLTDMARLLAADGVSLDQNADQQLSWREISNHEETISSALLAQLKFSQENGSCSPTQTGGFQLDSHANLPYLWLPVRVSCPHSGQVSLQYQGTFFELSQSHKLIANIMLSDATLNRILDVRQPTLLLSTGSASSLETAKEYLFQGIVHILIGTDHILFLLALLLTCVLYRDQGRWKGIQSPKSIFINTTWIITAFTLAHSITLTATALDLLPGNRWVELMIAISVLFAAMNNIFPLVSRLGWITFGFGLLHGMGFASVLGDLGLPARHTILAIVSFNLGVEVGQLAILLIALPGLIWLRHTWSYQRWIMPVSSAFIAIMAIRWSLERL